MAFAEHDPVPYYRPVAPEVPVAPREPVGDRLGGNLIAAFTQRAIASERAQLEQEALLQRADIAAKELAQRRDNMMLDHQIQSRALDLQSDLNDFKKENYESLIDYRDNAMNRTLQTNLQKAELVDQAGKDAEGAGLMDPKFQAEHPMEYAANAYHFKQLYEGSSDKYIQGAIKHFIEKAEASKVTLTDPSTGKAKEYPWSHIARDLITNQGSSPFIPALQDAGFVKTEETATTQPDLTQRMVGRIFGTGAKKTNIPVKYTVAPQLQKVIDDAKKADFSTVFPSKVAFGGNQLVDSKIQEQTPRPRRFIPAPAGTTSTPSGRLAANAPLPEPDKSQAETEAEYAKQKIASDPANADFYKQKYLERNPGNEALLQ